MTAEGWRCIEVICIRTLFIPVPVFLILICRPPLQLGSLGQAVYVLQWGFMTFCEEIRVVSFLCYLFIIIVKHNWTLEIGLNSFDMLLVHRLQCTVSYRSTQRIINTRTTPSAAYMPRFAFVLFKRA